jgi:hypothetical protein
MDLVRWTDNRLAKVLTLQLVLIDDEYRVAYCDGKLKNGERVLVSLGFTRLPRYNLRRMIVKHAKDAGVYAKGVGILDAIEIVN